MMRRRITFETEKIVIRSNRFEFNWCEGCAASGPQVTPAQAAILTGEEIEVLYSWAARDQVHSTRTPGGELMICLKSLSSVAGAQWLTQPKLNPS